MTSDHELWQGIKQIGRAYSSIAPTASRENNKQKLKKNENNREI